MGCMYFLIGGGNKLSGQVKISAKMYLALLKNIDGRIKGNGSLGGS